MEADQIIRSKNDKRDYELVTLENELKVLIISDPKCDKSIASMCVNVGSINDTVAGIAHYLEHMLFLGTEKYPNEGEFQKFIHTNSGENNAYTDLEQTVFYFQCANAAFPEALDRFSCFFHSPLFTQSCVEREMNAVNSEHEKNIHQDLWRLHQLRKSTSKTGHPYNRFATGSITTLNIPTIRDDLIKFYQEHYSANLMCLAIMGNLSVDEFKQIVTELFSKVPNKKYTRKTITDCPFEKEHLGQMFYIVPIQDYDYIEFQFVMEDQEKHYKNPPVSYIEHLLGHEGQNSLLSLLKAEGLGLELLSYSHNQISCFTLFNVKITLTKKGLAEYKKIINYTFAYLKMLREKGVQKWLFEEIQSMQQLVFDNQEVNKSIDYLISISDRMFKIPKKYLVKLPYLMEEFNPDLIQQSINLLDIDHMRIQLVSRSLEPQCTLQEPIYGTKYMNEKLANDIIDMFANPKLDGAPKKLDLPVKNIFIPKSMELLKADCAKLPLYPTRVFQDDECEIYYKQDQSFFAPQAAIVLMLRTNDNGICKSPKSNILASLWVDLFQQHINEMYYLAIMARLKLQTTFKDYIEMIFSGFNDSMESYVNEIFKMICTFNPSEYEDQFSDRLENLKLAYKNLEFKPPYLQYMEYAVTMLELTEFDLEIMKKEIEVITFADFVYFCKNWFKNLRFEWIIQGNLSEEMSLKIAKNAQEILKKHFNYQTLPKWDVPDQRCIDIPTKSTFIYEIQTNDKEKNSLMARYYQYGRTTIRNRLLTDLLHTAIGSTIFQELRTKQQLGYVVFSRLMVNKGVIGYNILVQSDKKSPTYIANRIDELIEKNLQEQMKSLTQQVFDEYKASVLNNLKKKYQTLSEEVIQNQIELIRHEYMFDRKVKSQQVLEEITLAELQQYFMDIFINQPKNLEFQMVSSAHREENQQLKEDRLKSTTSIQYVTSINWLKKQLSYHPDYYNQK